MKRIGLILALICMPAVAMAAGGGKYPKQLEWSFSGPFGTVDEQAAQRGFQVYREVCASCHGLEGVAFRTFTEIGFSADEVKALAAEYSVMDGPNDDGEMVERPGRPSDYYPNPYPNENAARAVNNGAYPPNLSLIVKARADGANYVYSLLTGYDEPMPEGMKMGEGQHYNPYMAGEKIAMAAPLIEGAIDYQDGTEASVEQMAYDVTNFLQWTASPEMEARKRLGLKVILFLIIFTGFSYVAMKRIWADVKKK